MVLALTCMVPTVLELLPSAPPEAPSALPSEGAGTAPGRVARSAPWATLRGDGASALLTRALPKRRSAAPSVARLYSIRYSGYTSK